MKIAVIIYHKNLESTYKWSWVMQSVKSMIDQSNNDFTFYELNYGADGYSVLSKIKYSGIFYFYNEKMENHADAINYLFEKCISDNIDVIFNTNIDDYYDLDRIKIQLSKIKEGYDIVTSNFIQIDESNNIIKHMNMSGLDMKEELIKNHNLIAHPSVCYSSSFFKKNRYISSEIPKEDLLLWKRTFNKFKFFICDEYLLNYRVHSNQITQITQTIPNNINNNQLNINLFNNRDICRCGTPKNRQNSNFCQKCNTLY